MIIGGKWNRKECEHLCQHCDPQNVTFNPWHQTKCLHCVHKHTSPRFSHTVINEKQSRISHDLWYYIHSFISLPFFRQGLIIVSVFCPRAGLSGSKAAVQPKGRSSIANSGTKAVDLLGMNRCGNFALLSASYFLVSIWIKNKSVALQPRRAKTGWSACCQVAVVSKALILFSVFLTGFRYFSYEIATQLSSRGWVDPVPEPILPETFLGYSWGSNPGPLG